jgi:glycosyltransferase involved in cell wall biosynthesis
LLSALRRIRPDVIYQRVACGYTGICAYYARKHGARLIWHVAHDSDVIPGQSLDVGRNLLRRYVEKRSIEYGIRHATEIVAQTEDQARLLQKYYGRAASRVVRNFHADPVEPIDKSGPLLVLWIANLKPWKQPEVFVRLARHLSDLEAVTFVMVGAESSGAGDALWARTLLHDIGATRNLQYLGEKTQEEVNRLLAQGHLLINTSVAEGFPNTFIQAWMREVPVVSLHVNPDGVLGRQAVGLCAGSEPELNRMTRELLESPSRRLLYGSRSAEYAMTHHSLRNTALLADLIDSSRGAKPVG